MSKSDDGWTSGGAKHDHMQRRVTQCRAGPRELRKRVRRERERCDQQERTGRGYGKTPRNIGSATRVTDREGRYREGASERRAQHRGSKSPRIRGKARNRRSVRAGGKSRQARLLMEEKCSRAAQ